MTNIPYRTSRFNTVARPDSLSQPDKPARAAACDCHACGRTFTYQKPAGDDSGRLCSPRCRVAYDNGLPTCDPAHANKSNPRWYAGWTAPDGQSLGYMPHTPMRSGRVGFFIACAACGGKFESKGLRCCSTACERKHRDREATIATMVEVGSELPARRKCEAPGCNRDVARYTGEGKKRRLTSRKVRYCSPRCKQAVYRHFQASNRNETTRRAPPYMDRFFRNAPATRKAVRA